ncbi:hypothetical protein GCM10027275_02100 [Rhabdobacter roseus]|uniref:DUF748 domain-containing protein n=1 Tax=Rhabdobacter roseus TaxID=1655419 RepID=A0A840TJX3_9BACT|nr:hypothetical protein [Rhabdobacter roseus]MBB5282097.1 hypothetical protein [Rhabdobacter roseus]
MNDRTKVLLRKWILGLAAFFGGLLLLSLLASWLLPRYFDQKLDSTLKQAVQEASDGLYSIQYDDISINIPLGNAEISGVVLKPDTAVYQRLVEQEKAPDQYLNLRTEKIRLNGISIVKLLLFKALSMDELAIQKPFLVIANKKRHYNESKESKPPYELIRDELNAIRIKKISLEEVDVVSINNNQSEPQKSHFKQLQLHVRDFRLNEDSEKDSSRILFSESIDLRVESLKLPVSNKLSSFTLQELTLSSQDSLLGVKQIHYKPLYSKSRFGKVAGIATDRLDLKFNDIRGKRVDVRKLLVERALWIRELGIQKGVMDIFRDQRYPKVPKDFKPYPHQLLQAADLTVRIDTIKIKGTDVIYGEVNDKSHQRGEIQFKGTYGTITNLTNDTTRIAQVPRCLVNVQTRFMGTGRLYAYFDFNLASTNGAFRCGGKMRNFELKEVDEVTRPLALAGVESGHLSLLDFNIRATARRSHITMRMEYEDLKAKVLKLDEDSGELEKRSFISNILNNIVIQSNNPRGNRTARIGEASLDRTHDQSFFTVIWQTILEAIKRITTGKDDSDE